jgi:type III pantothenate kinase
MLLAMDVGNTNIILGVYDGSKLAARFRLTTVHERTRDEYGVMFINMLSSKGIKADDIDNVIISSVVPPIMYSLERAVLNYIGKEPIIIDIDTPLGINVHIDNPRELGADRLVNAYGAYKMYGGPLIVVDFGTATTFCAIDKNGDYLGGAICPGIKISLEALFSRTAKLPRVEIARPPFVIGKNTVHSMQSGILYGYVGQVEKITAIIRKELGDINARVIATGGFVDLIAGETNVFHAVNKNLTLESLRLIYENIYKDIKSK